MVLQEEGLTGSIPWEEEGICNGMAALKRLLPPWPGSTPLHVAPHSSTRTCLQLCSTLPLVINIISNGETAFPHASISARAPCHAACFATVASISITLCKPRLPQRAFSCGSMYVALLAIILFVRLIGFRALLPQPHACISSISPSAWPSPLHV